MELEQQVCSLPLAQRLKELGVKQESYWHWAVHENGAVRGLEHQTYTKTAQFAIDYFSAFTTGELGEMLPSGTISYFDAYDDWQCKAHVTDKQIKREWSEADARAKMLIYLIENQLLELPKAA